MLGLALDDRPAAGLDAALEGVATREDEAVDVAVEPGGLEASLEAGCYGQHDGS